MSVRLEFHDSSDRRGRGGERSQGRGRGNTSGQWRGRESTSSSQRGRENMSDQWRGRESTSSSQRGRENMSDQWRDRGSISGAERRRGSGRLPNRPPRTGRGRGGGRGFTMKPPSIYRPKPEVKEPKDIEVQVEDIIYHAFMPKKLPENAQEHLVDVEEKLMEYFITGISDSIAACNGFHQLDASQMMMEKWKEMQPKWRSDADEEHFVHSLQQGILNQKEGETLPIYVRKQNCMLLITKLDEKFTQLATFRAMLSSETVMSSVGSHVLMFPQTCDVFYNKDLLVSNMHLCHLHQLAVNDFEISLPCTHKGEKSLPDYRDVPDPFLVTDWWSVALVPANYTPESNENPLFGNIKIQKKIRDQVNCEMSSRAIPFRRSGMYLSLKGTLQLKLIQDIRDINDARLLYKLIMLRILVGICKKYSKECVNINLDLSSQMLAKLGRRVSKLEKMKFSQKTSEDGANDEYQDKLKLLKEKCLEYCHSVVESLHMEINTLWMQDASTHSIVKPIIRSSEDFQKDLLHEIVWLDDHIRNSRSIILDIKAQSKRIQLLNLQKAEALRKCVDFQRSLQVKRYITLEDILKNQHAFNSQYSDIGDINERIWVYDAEYYIKHRLDSEIGENTEQIQNLIVAYFKNAVARYTASNDPVALSQMILVILKCIHVMDTICTVKYPLLLKYKSGINVKQFDKLQLPHQQDIQLLNQISDYFASRNQALMSSLIECNTPQALSFPVCFAEQSELMNEIRQRILTDTSKLERDKRAEVMKVKAECESLEREWRALGGACKSEDGRIHDNEKGSRSFESISCKQCRVSSILRFKKRTVKIFERPLPVEEYLQYAVIFELKIPPEIALLRDMLAILNFEILGGKLFNGSQTRRSDSVKPPPVEDWRAYMKRKGVSDDYKSKGGSPLNCIDFVSPRLAFSGTCNAKLYNPDLLVTPLEEFIVNNDLDCVYYHEKPLWFPIIKNTSEICTFQLHSTNKPDALIYENLQWTVGSTSHTQNKVLAESHTNCHRQLTPEEYIVFGSIRADGDRIQMWNLYRAIYDRSISLKKEPVLALVLQALWQVGPLIENKIREFHQDFLTAEFSLEFLEMLDDLVDSCEGNYSEPIVLMIAVVVIIRIIELSPDNCKEVGYNILKKSRNVIKGWVAKIEENLTVSTNNDDSTSVNCLKARLLESTLCCMFSYNVSSENKSQVLKCEEDFVHWFHAISRLHQLTEEELCHKSISPFCLTLLNIARNIPLKLELEKYLESDDDQAKVVMLQSLHRFTCERWSKAEDCITNTSTWKLFNAKENPHIIFGGYEEIIPNSNRKAQHFLSLDLIQGTFLINGFPQANLPAVILAHPLFKRFFKDSKFRIQRYSTCARTVDKFHGRHYDFEMVLTQAKEKIDVESLIIREIQEDKSGSRRVLEMIEPVLFKHVVGGSLSENYTHWLDAEKKVVYFRRLPKAEANYQLLHDYVLKRDDRGGKWRFYDERLRKYLLSINSDGFKLVTSALSRMEVKEEINVLLDIVSGQVTAKLSRYGLDFILKDTGLHSVEYTDFRISERQNYGTLIGLLHGLLLTSTVLDSKRILIMPHGYLFESCLLTMKNHHNTLIDIDHLRYPKFFVYDYDTVLRQLKGNRSQASWLYLAALHARTSSSLPDPFTQITGTERCMEILQSGRVWPSEPYDSESLDTLGQIRDLAPVRSYYAHGISILDESRKKKKPKEKMEITKWCDVIPPMASYDGFPFIVDKLLENGGRLIELHGDKIPPQKIKRRYKECDRDTGEESEKLSLRAYHRHLSLYNQAAFISPEFFKKSCTEMLGTGDKLQYNLRSTSSSSVPEEFCLREMQIISQTRLVNTFEKKPIKQWKSINLESYLISFFPVAPLIHASTSLSSLESLRLKDLLNMEFEINWLQLYAWARNKACGQSQAFGLILSGLGYTSSATLEQVMHLHHISYFAANEEFPEVPTTLACPQPTKRSRPIVGEGDSKARDEDFDPEDLIIPIDCDYDAAEIQKILESNMVPAGVCAVEESETALAQHLETVRADAERIAFEISSYWPCQNIQKNDEKVIEIFKNSTIRFNDAMDVINRKIEFWYRNLEFNEFIKNVQDKLSTSLKMKLDEGKIQESHELYHEFQFSPFRDINLHLGVLVDGMEELSLPEMITNLKMLDEANNIFESGHWLKKEDLKEKDLVDLRKIHIDKILSLITDISENIMGSSDEIGKKIIVKCGIAPRITPTQLLRYLINHQLCQESNPLWIYVGALGVLWTHLKRINRCIVFHKMGESAVSDLKKERKNLGHEGWSTKTYPEWLLLELELDIMIRPIQIKVAYQMMTMPDGKNGATQLNMGEGKTAVIVPMLCATLASDDALCRITVLSSLYKTNLNILRFAIGGLLNRRLYTFPCRRNVQLDVKKVKILSESLEECLKAKGVILTVPEHRLSFRLLALDKIKKQHYELGGKLLHIENWLRYFCRDILDECDELLRVNYQLVYTTGTQIDIDGESIRWTMCQRILNSMREIAGNLQSNFGIDVIEFDEEKQTQVPEQFTNIRLLSEDCLDELKEMIADDLLTDLKLDGVQRMMAKLFMTEEMISKENHETVIKGMEDKPEILEKILLASAYLRREVLTVGLKKRWRVEYGVDPKGNYRYMAVPFQAKDVAKERNEFGHPDLAIVLTHLSYYYSGLNDDQLRECFELLKNKRGGEEIYDDWLTQMRPGVVPSNLRRFQRLNFADTEQCISLFKILKRHKSVIDFWLSHQVFPRESKQFPGKFVMTGWDLCSERNRCLITGFSGTNDSQDLLPLTISQQDLEELSSTNQDVEDALLKPQNNQNHKGFRMGVNCEEILTSMKNDNLKILIDSGALMLECNNEQVADLWLIIDLEIEAVVYFSEDGEEMVKCRRENEGDEKRTINDVRLEESPLKYHLEKCNVFLDDHHTRGVDLKFPDGSRACVTIGSRMKREKLVQACLRMRKLLDGEHSVVFYLSHEAHNKVNDRSDYIETEDIFEWVKQNTMEFNQDNLLYLCLNGLNYAQKLVAEDNLNYPLHLIPFEASASKSNAMLKILAEQCGNDEVTTLMDLYGRYSKRERLIDILPIWFEMARNRVVSMNGKGSPIPREIISNFKRIQAALLEKCKEIYEDKSVFSSCGAHAFEEEQEKELDTEKEKETEVEEEREVQKSGPPTHIYPETHSNVKLAILKGGEELRKKPGILGICEIFKNTTFWKDVQPDCWGENVFATEEFARVIGVNGNHLTTDLYLRPIHWIASYEDDKCAVKLLLLSPFEVNEMMPLWRKEEEGAVMQLHMFSRRRFQNQDLLVNKKGLQLPIGNGDSTNIGSNYMTLAPLLVASGNLYFGKEEEKEAYENFLGISGESQDDDREHKFVRDPTPVIKKILSCRHPILSQVSHVMKLLDGQVYSIN